MENKIIPLVDAPEGVFWIEMPRFTDERGELTVAEHDMLPFSPQRTFWVTNIPEKAQRGGHAHRTTRELFSALRGSCLVELKDNAKRIVVEVNSSTQFLHIPPMVWARLYNFSNDFVGLCFTSESYRPEGYIHSFEEYLKESHSIKHNAASS